MLIPTQAEKPKPQLIPLYLDFPEYTKPKDKSGIDLSDCKSPCLHAIAFLRKLENLNGDYRKSTIKQLKEFLITKHVECFGCPPSEGLPCQVIKARVALRLQYIGHVMTETEPSAGFMTNYLAAMKFVDEPGHWFDGFEPQVASIANRLIGTMPAISNTAIKTVEKKRVDVEKVKAKADRIRERLARLEGKTVGRPHLVSNLKHSVATNEVVTQGRNATLKPPAKRVKVLGKYSGTMIVYWFAKKHNATINTIRSAFSLLGVPISESTLLSYSRSCREGFPPVTNEDEKILLDTLKKIAK